jgi:hypothetical protein
MKGMLSRISVALAIAAFGLATRARAASGPLDGKTFFAQSGEEGKAADSKDTLVFQDGKMRSTACDAYGFGDGVYSAIERKGSTGFHARTQSAKEGIIVWNGAVRSDALEGTFVWTKPGQKEIHYWVKGKLKKPGDKTP